MSGVRLVTVEEVEKLMDVDMLEVGKIAIKREEIIVPFVTIPTTMYSLSRFWVIDFMGTIIYEGDANDVVLYANGFNGFIDEEVFEDE